MFPMDRFREDGVIETEAVTCPDPGDQGACPIRTGDILFDVAVDRSNGTLYAVWQDARFGGVTHDDIALSRSTDGGTTWSSPIKVNHTPADEPANEHSTKRCDDRLRPQPFCGGRSAAAEHGSSVLISRSPSRRYSRSEYGVDWGDLWHMARRGPAARAPG